ncbi:hypothetical protein ABIS04_15465 [Shewanella sp. H8]|uniref:hypothetical protein n=1 Tax=Shewanella sp. H8 TaxID=3342676 RepID=UPI0033148A0C
MTYVLHRVNNPPNVWHFDCRADGYFNHLGELPLTVEKSNAELTFSIENNQAKLTYRLQSLTSGIEIAQLFGEVELLDIGSLTYHLVLTLQPIDWQDNSLLRPYLENEFSIAAEELLAEEVGVSQQIQISYLDKTLTKARLDFVPSNNVWACQIN